MEILYLAKFAPKNNILRNKDLSPENKFYSEYHKIVYDILCETGNKIISENNLDNILNLEKKPDYIFSLYNKSHFNNSEIFVSMIAEYYKIPYLGAKPSIRAIAEDKHLAKVMAIKADILTAKWHVFDHLSGKINNLKILDFSEPYFIKPRYGATSIDINEFSIAYNNEAAIKQINMLLNKKVDVIVEEYIEGTNYTVPLILDKDLNPNILNPVQEISDEKIITYEQKRKTNNGLERTISLKKELNQELKNIVLNYYNLIKPLDYARLDFIVSQTGQIYFLEINLCCNIGPYSAIALSASNSGIEYKDLISNILQYSLKRQIKVFD